jgi:hypothetical protein
MRASGRAIGSSGDPSRGAIVELMVNQTYPSLTPFHPVSSVVLSRYYKATMDRGSTASYYVAFRYVSPNTNTPGTMASDKSDFSYKIRHCAHPTDTNG